MASSTRINIRKEVRLGDTDYEATLLRWLEERDENDAVLSGESAASDAEEPQPNAHTGSGLDPDYVAQSDSSDSDSGDLNEETGEQIQIETVTSGINKDLFVAVLSGLLWKKTPPPSLRSPKYNTLRSN